MRQGRTQLLRVVFLIALTFVGAASPAATGAAVAGGLSPGTTTQAYPPPPLLASAAALLDADTGQWLYLANADTPLPMASTTKIMTALLAIEHGHLGDLVRVSRAAATVGESSMGLVTGERLSVQNLLYGLLLNSGNDAAVALAEHVAGSQQRFVALMNARARSLRLRHTHFTNAYGFSLTADGDDPQHYTSARDLVLLARVAQRLPLFRRIVSTRSAVIPATRHNPEHDLTSVNYFLYWYPGADGVKPGWTSGAGLCQVLDARRNGRHLIAAILNTPNLYTDARDLMNYGFGDFTWVPSRWPDTDTVDQVVHGGPPDNPYFYYPYSGHGVHGAFLTYFLRHDQLRVFGFPRTEEVLVDGDIEQFFTNQVLSYSPQSRTVSALRLGLAVVPSSSLAQRLPRRLDTDSSTYYPQTGHTVTNRFRLFYLAHGGPTTFGYPLSEKLFSGALLVQYFENAEFIWHPTSNTDGYVALAPLGVARLARLGLLTAPPPIAQPSKTAQPVGPRFSEPTAMRSPRPPATATVRNTASAVPAWTAPPTPTPTATPSATPSLQATPISTPPAVPTEAPPATATSALQIEAPSTPTPPPPLGLVTPFPSPSSPTAVPYGTDTPVPPGTPAG